jgi:hypothetical protein
VAALNLKQGHIYFLGMKDPTGEQDFTHYKIGITDGTVLDRINQLQTGNPFEIFEYESFHSQAAQLIELQLHKRWAQERVRLEWFKLTKDQLAAIIKEARDYEQQIGEKAVRVRQFDQQPSNGQLLPPSESVLELHAQAQVLLAEQVQNKLRLDQLENKLRSLTGLTAGIAGITQVTTTKPAARFQAREFRETYQEIYERFLTVDRLACGFQLEGKPRVTAYPELHEAVKKSKDSVPELTSDFSLEEIARTEDAVQLHQQYLQETEEAARIKSELLLAQLHLRDLCGENEGIEEVCSYRREITQELDKEALQRAHPEKYQSCVREVQSKPRFKIMESRAY